MALALPLLYIFIYKSLYIFIIIYIYNMYISGVLIFNI